MEQHVRLKCQDSTIEAVEYGGDRWPVEKGHVVLPAGAADALTRQPGAAFTHILAAPIVVRKVVVPIRKIEEADDVMGRYPKRKR